uniref:Carbohydrate binding domain-containing protein n=1 Tax=Ditylenchus dipsaci TaxID=166011 RepID=A0A915E7H8_9BILA
MLEMTGEIVLQTELGAKILHFINFDMGTFTVLAVFAIAVCCMVTGQSTLDTVLNVPQTDSNFTFYGGTGRGACGLDYDATIDGFSAAGSGQLFSPNAQWVPSDLPDGRYVLDDPICKGICATVEYNGKSITVPINNQCPECSVRHIDLSQGAFAHLEPKLGEVGIGRNATITYVFCNSTTVYTPSTDSTSPTTLASSDTTAETTTVPSDVSVTSEANPATSSVAAGSDVTDQPTPSSDAGTETTPSDSSINSTISRASAGLVVAVNIISSWNEGMQVTLVFTNNDDKPVCSASFSLGLQSDQPVSSSWNMDSGANAGQYNLPSWLNISANRGDYSSTGFMTSGSNHTPPTVTVLDFGYC